MNTIMIMFIPVMENNFAWRTQDPEYDWDMVGHLLIKNGSILLIDPPYVHGIEQAVTFMGKPEAIIITTADHTRGSRYLSYKLKIPLYVPDQGDSISVSPGEIYREKKIANYKAYNEGPIFWLNAKRVKVYRKKEDKVPYIDEMILADNDGNIFTGDIAMGSSSCELLTCNEGFTDEPDTMLVKSSFESLKNATKELNKNNLISSHGTDIVGNLDEKIKKKMRLISD